MIYTLFDVFELNATILSLLRLRNETLSFWLVLKLFERKLKRIFTNIKDIGSALNQIGRRKYSIEVEALTLFSHLLNFCIF